MIGSGGTKGGLRKYTIGFGLAALATYLFLDSVKVSTMGHGVVSGLNRGLGLGGFWETTSMAIIFVPFFIGVIALFYNAKWKWAWALIYLGLIILVIEILSRIRFFQGFVKLPDAAVQSGAMRIVSLCFFPGNIFHFFRYIGPSDGTLSTGGCWPLM